MCRELALEFSLFSLRFLHAGTERRRFPVRHGARVRLVQNHSLELAPVTEHRPSEAARQHKCAQSPDRHQDATASFRTIRRREPSQLTLALLASLHEVALELEPRLVAHALELRRADRFETHLFFDEASLVGEPSLAFLLDTPRFFRDARAFGRHLGFNRCGARCFRFFSRDLDALAFVRKQLVERKQKRGLLEIGHGALPLRREAPAHAWLSGARRTTRRGASVSIV